MTLVQGGNAAAKAVLGTTPSRVRVMINRETKITGVRGVPGGFRVLVRGSRIVATFKAPSGAGIGDLPAARTIATLGGSAVSSGEVAPAQWNSNYAWESGHGYSGWFPKKATPDADGYGVATAHGGVPGLWIWLKGGRRYGPGYVEWVYRAPGQTRILSTEVTLGSTDKLFSHHCVEVGLRDAQGVRALKSFCSPPDTTADATAGVPMHDEHQIAVRLSDPADVPLATELFVRVVFPDCRNPQSPSCRKYVPRHDPLVNGPMFRVPAVQLRMVDDDLPGVVASGPFPDLDGTYVNGQESYGVSIDARDNGSGVRRVNLGGVGRAEAGVWDSPCDETHGTPALGAALCPSRVRVGMQVSTLLIPEGMHAYRSTATDVTGHTGMSGTWNFRVDRTPPSPPSGPSIAFISDSGDAEISWIAGADPDLIDGSPGSGVAAEEYRYRRGSGDWSSWTQAATPSFFIDSVESGAVIRLEFRSTDRVGNASPIVAADLTVPDSAGCEALARPAWSTSLRSVLPRDTPIDVFTFTVPQSPSSWPAQLPAGAQVLSVIESTPAGVETQSSALTLAPGISVAENLAIYRSEVLSKLGIIERRLTADRASFSGADLRAVNRQLASVQSRLDLYRDSGVPIKGFAIRHDPAVAAAIVGAYAGKLDTADSPVGTPPDPCVVPSSSASVGAQGGADSAGAEPGLVTAAVSSGDEQDGPVERNVVKHSYSPSRVEVDGKSDTSYNVGGKTYAFHTVGVSWRWGSLSNIAYWSNSKRKSDYERGYEMQVNLNAEPPNTPGRIDATWGRPPWEDSRPPEISDGPFVYLHNLRGCGYAEDYFEDDLDRGYALTIGSACRPRALLLMQYWFHPLARHVGSDHATVSVQPVHVAQDPANKGYCTLRILADGSCFFGDRGVALAQLNAYADGRRDGNGNPALKLAPLPGESFLYRAP